MYSKDYLAHYGIPGMRWGHHKLARESYNRMYDEEFKRESKSSEKLGAKMLEYANKHKLAYDDGAGGTDHQQAVYRRMLEKQFDLEIEAHDRARQSAGKKFIEEYGELEYRHIKRVDHAKTAAALAVVFGLPIAAITGVSLLAGRIISGH